MTYFDHIKGGVPLPDPEKCDKPCKDQDGKEEEGTVGEKVLGNRLSKEGKRQPGYNTRHYTHSTTVSFLLHCRQEAAFVVQFFKGFLYSVTNCPLTKQPNKALRNIPRKANSFIMRSNEISYLTTRIHKIFNNLFFIHF